nr:glucose-6-phosphate isomerase [Ornithinimicrobium sediminis]
MLIEALGDAATAVERHLPALVEERFASRLFARDTSLWGSDAQEEASRRLAWVDLPRSSRPLLGQIAALRDQLTGRGVQRIVLCGMGGSSLAPEVICATAGVDLVVLDSSDPDAVRGAVRERVEQTAVVVSSKSGGTVETDSQRRVFVEAFERAGIDPTERIVVVTDPGSPLDHSAGVGGYTVVHAEPDLGGRYSALSAFGLVPSGLAGVDVERLLDEAEEVADLLAEDDVANPALRLGAALGGTQPLRDKLLLTDQGSGIVGFADWAEQLLAESTGKDGTGLLPVVVGTDNDPTAAITDVSDLAVVAFTADPSDSEDDVDPTPTAEVTGSVVNVAGPLGAQFLLWEAATAVAGHLLGVDPFDQPDVESAKHAARERMQAGTGAVGEPEATDGPVQIRTTGGRWWSPAAEDALSSALEALLARVDPQTGYVAVMAYLDRAVHPDVADVREVLTERVGRPVTFGWGPRFLHSTGQLHKGGPPTGVYLQITADPIEDLPVPEQDFTFGQLIAAQAAGDAAVLGDLGRPVLCLHLTDHTDGLNLVRRTLEG